MPYQISEACNRCGACLPVCPSGSIVAAPSRFLIDPDTCQDHGACAAACPTKAITAMKADSPLLKAWASAAAGGAKERKSK